jgi:outer membrane protein OmpA-like peptidoglycan-associated protein
MEKVGTVFMASGSYSLNDATKLTLKAIALKINASGAKSILVYGHTDSRGGVNNTVLSQNRAKAVANYLRPLVRVKKISIGWYASKKPVAGGTSATALAQNRRVEIYTK